MTAADIAGRWVAVSTGGQDEKEQEPDIDRWIASHGYVPGKTYRLHGVSRYTGKAKHDAALRSVIADMQAGVINVLVVWISDRIERRGAWNALDLAKQVREAGGRIEYVKDSYLNEVNDMSDTMLAFTASANNRESRVKRERYFMADATRQEKSAEKGVTLWRGGRVPFGKRAVCLCHDIENCPDRDNKFKWTLVVHAANAAMLTDVARKIVAGKSANACTGDLNTSGMLSADGKAWNAHTLRKILRRVETADVIGAGLWADVIAVIGYKPRAGNRGTRTQTDDVILDLVWCGDCADAGRDIGKLYAIVNRYGKAFARCRNYMKASQLPLQQRCRVQGGHGVPSWWLEAEAHRTMMRATDNGQAMCQERVSSGAAGLKAIRRDRIDADLIALAAKRRTMERDAYRAQRDALDDELDALEAEQDTATGPAWRDTGETVAARWDRLSASDRRLWLLSAGVRFTVRQTHLQAPLGRWMLTYEVQSAEEQQQRIVRHQAAAEVVLAA